MSKKDFAEILTSLFNGNSGEARQTAENILYDNTYNLEEDYERIRQDRANFELAKLRRICYND